MTMIQLSQETEKLIETKAMSTGRTPDEIVRAAVAVTGDILPWRSPARAKPPAETKEQLIAGMEEIAVRSAARPVVDPRSADEIIGYDDFGLPR
jgi:antitoxin VapB